MKYIKGDSIEISYDNAKPEIATLKPFSTDTLVGILIAVGFIAVIVSGLNYYFTQKYILYKSMKCVPICFAFSLVSTQRREPTAELALVQV
jgi:hypothetical protein